MGMQAACMCANVALMLADISSLLLNAVVCICWGFTLSFRFLQIIAGETRMRDSKPDPVQASFSNQIATL